MAKDVEIKINHAAARELLNGPEIMNMLSEKAEAIAASARSKGDGQYYRNVQAGKNRAHARVRTMDQHTANLEHANHILLKSIDAGR